MKKVQFLTIVVLVLVFCLSGIVPGFAKGPPPEYYIDESKLPFDALQGTDTSRYWGIHGGAGYRIEVPSAWNGELVLYCHGFHMMSLFRIPLFIGVRASQ